MSFDQLIDHVDNEQELYPAEDDVAVDVEHWLSEDEL